MNVINISIYRRKREIEILEKKMAALAQQPRGTASEMKSCFKEWLMKTSLK